MKLGELLDSSYGSIGIGYLVTTDGKALDKLLGKALNLTDYHGPMTADALKRKLDTVDETIRNQIRAIEISDTKINNAGGVKKEIRDLTEPSPGERMARNWMGVLMCLVMAGCNIAITAATVIVSIARKEFPSTMLVATVIIPTMCIAWYYMGIINKERRDILSAVFGDNLKNGTIGEIVSVVRNRNKTDQS
ncbi:hypothetical protein [Pectobacterium phage vB_ParM-25]|nr:hypothetical protein [Pectobacterium phage vB_ParM-25]